MILLPRLAPLIPFGAVLLVACAGGLPIEPGADLSGADLSGRDLSDVDLSDADLTGANLNGANLSGANLKGANLEGASLAGTTLAGANLSGANLSEANFVGIDLSGVSLSGANLRGSILIHQNLSGVDLSGADLTDANLRKAKLRGANLTGAILDGASLLGAEGLTNEQLSTAASLTDARLESREEIFEAVGQVCRGSGVVSAAPYAREPGAHPIVLLNSSGGQHAWNENLPSSWEPLAIRFTELVACIEEKKEVLDVCEYRPYGLIRRYLNEAVIALVEARTGETVATHTISSPPASCPPRLETRLGGNPHAPGTDTPVSWDAAHGWLRQFVSP